MYLHALELLNPFALASPSVHAVLRTVSQVPRIGIAVSSLEAVAWLALKFDLPLDPCETPHSGRPR